MTDAFTFRVMVEDVPAKPAESCAVMVKEEGPLVAGGPLKTPDVALSASPEGGVLME